MTSFALKNGTHWDCFKSLYAIKKTPTCSVWSNLSNVLSVFSIKENNNSLQWHSNIALEPRGSLSFSHHGQLLQSGCLTSKSERMLLAVQKHKCGHKSQPSGHSWETRPQHEEKQRSLLNILIFHPAVKLENVCVHALWSEPCMGEHTAHKN